MKFNQLTIKDKELFDKFLSFDRQRLSAYAFENIYIWRGLFDISWLLIRNSLCVFFNQQGGCFLYLAPQAESLKPEVVKEAFEIMDTFNKNRAVSRIENVPEEKIGFYENLGYICKEKPGDYLYRRADLVQLNGNRFKHKRASVNHFLKNYKFQYLSFSLSQRDDCLNLYDSWMDERRAQNKDALYQGMLEDSRNCLAVLLNAYADLDVIGRIVCVDKKIKAFTFGFKLDEDTFCILYEIADLSLKGLSQFIFREFCLEMKKYQYINIMDDSGLENLKQLKSSYRPLKVIPSYIVTRKDA